MTAPRAPQWPLIPALRFAALAMVLSVGAIMTTGVLSIVLWLGALVSVVLAAVKLWKSWPKRR
jgi:hypothetical protein